MDNIEKKILKQIAEIEKTPFGAYNLRINGQKTERQTTANVDIVSKENMDGIDIFVKENTKDESIHIPVILSQSGLVDKVYNDFYIGKNADVVIVAGCGIHNSSCETSEHDGIHRFFLEDGAKVKYIEKHYGEGDGEGKRILNPVTEVYLKENATLEMESVQIKGVDSTLRITKAEIGANSTFIIREKIMTHGNQVAKTEFEVNLNGENSSTNVISRSVAKENSTQEFVSKVNGNGKCFGHVECDAIIMDNAKVSSMPQVVANHIDASLTHEAAIGKIAGEQLIKLMSLGLTQKEAEKQIINGFLN